MAGWLCGVVGDSERGIFVPNKENDDSRANRAHVKKMCMCARKCMSVLCVNIGGIHSLDGDPCLPVGSTAVTATNVF